MSNARLSTRRHVLAGTVLLVLLSGAVGGWAATTQLSGAVIAAGTLVVSDDVKKVQHPTGGVVKEINVREGARVKAGDVLVRLDDTLTRANLAIVPRISTNWRRAKPAWRPERDDADGVIFPPALTGRAGTAEVDRNSSG